MGPSFSELIDREVSAWEGIESHPHRFGGREYRLGTREIGHVHGDRLVDIPLPRRLRDRAIERGLARPHHVLPDSGWVSVPLHDREDVEGAIELLAQSLELARGQRERRQGTSG